MFVFFYSRHLNPDKEATKLIEKLKKQLPEKVFDALKLKTYNFIRIRDFVVSYKVKQKEKKERIKKKKLKNLGS